jgi:hypothetical protein
MIWKIWRKSKLNSEKKGKIWKKPVSSAAAAAIYPRAALTRTFSHFFFSFSIFFPFIYLFIFFFYYFFFYISIIISNIFFHTTFSTSNNTKLCTMVVASTGFCEMIWKIWKKCEMIWKIWRNSKLNSEKIGKIWKKPVSRVAAAATSLLENPVEATTIVHNFVLLLQ